MIKQCRDVRLSLPLEETLALLDRGLSDHEVADRLHKSKRTIEEHKRKILEPFGEQMENRQRGFGDLRPEYGVGPSDLVNDQPGHRPPRGLLRRALSWLNPSETRASDVPDFTAISRQGPENRGNARVPGQPSEAHLGRRAPAPRGTHITAQTSSSADERVSG
ncbi:hypothetical protein ACWEGE_14575 [Amycolatopsis sp. NPDC004747]